MALEFSRNSGPKCPPLLLGGCIIMCFFLLCNWWSLSSQNFELLKQIDNLAEQLRTNGEELGKCSQQQGLLDEKLKDSQNKFIQQQIKIEQFKETENDVKGAYEKLQEELNEVKKNCESLEKQLVSCNADKISFQRTELTQKETLEALQTRETKLEKEMSKKNKMLKLLENKFDELQKSRDGSQKAFGTPSVIQIMENKVKSNKTLMGKDPEKTVEEVDVDKNYGDSSPFAQENDDPREEEMNVKLPDSNQ